MSKRIPSYRQHKPSGQAVVTLNGKDHYLGPWGSDLSRNEYDRLVCEWLANGRRLPNSEANDITIVELIAGYLKFAKSYYASDRDTTSEYTCLRDALRPVRQLYGETLANDFGPLALKAVRQKMIDRGWCRTHINRQVNRVRRAFRWGIENELVRADVIQALSAVAPLKKGRTEARETDPVRPVNDEHVKAVLPFVSRQVAGMIKLQRLTGMRPGEVVQIRPIDVDRSGDVWLYRPENHKTSYRGNAREIYFGPKAQDILRPWLLRADTSFCFSPAEAEEERNAERRKSRRTPLTPSHKARRRNAKGRKLKERYDTDSYRRAIKYGIRKAGVPNWHPHQLRHSCGTEIREHFGLDIAQVILGHSTADVTQVYAEADRARAISAVRRVG